MTFFAAFREGQFLRKQSRSRFFLKNPEAIPGISQAPMVGPTVGLFIYSLNWDRNASCRLRDALGGDTRNECFLAQKSLYFTVFRPQTTVWPSLGRISVEILMVTTRSRQIF